ncbi:50S ribosomal protein L11 [Candidatus Bathyarchaeota archaeon]|nr:50S ribosomal protein L11 [Candidatus Bathyarchaeota archaeon]MBS7629596.1 50S ribosomal protein L11 [Candidatus Bathyarchaeota archaeon]
MGEKKTVEALINGGEATAGPPLGPALGPLGVNVLQIVNAINELTKAYAGMKVPVKVIVDIDTKAFEVEIGTPSTSALIIRELGVEKGSGNPKAEKIGNLPIEKALKIAQMKMKDTYSKDVKAALKEILGTFVSMGVTVENKDPREIQKDIDRGVYEELFKGES